VQEGARGARRGAGIPVERATSECLGTAPVGPGDVVDEPTTVTAVNGDLARGNTLGEARFDVGGASSLGRRCAGCTHRQRGQCNQGDDAPASE